MSTRYIELATEAPEAEDDFPIVGVDVGISMDEASMDPSAGGTAYNKPIWTADQAASYLNRTGGQYGNGANDLMPEGGNANVITFGFHENQQSLIDNGYIYTRPNAQGVTTLYAFSEYFQFGSFTEAQRAATREAMGYWDDVIAVDFVETHANEGDINFGNLTNSPNTQAYSRIPTAGYATNFGGFYGTYSIAGLAGDVWVSASQASNFQFDEGLYGMNTLVHEVGHSLGLSHPGAYNFGPGFAVTYQNGAEYAQDLRNYSIMSYWNPRSVGIQDHDYHLGTISYGATPMVHDILAAQRMYGVETTTRTGDTTYGFNATADVAGRDAFDFTKTPAPVMAIWDAGGIDTLDASGYATNQIIDLTPGSLSSIGGVTLANAPTLEQVNINRAAAGYAPLPQSAYDIRMNNLRNDPDAGRLVDNVGIAYGAVIENAVGGSGNDKLFGNTANNVLTGNAGNDRLEGRDGNDKLNGGDGDDTLLGGDGIDVFTGGADDDVVEAEINATKTATKKMGAISIDIITDFDAAGNDLIDLTGLDQAFNFRGTDANKAAGDLTYKAFTSVNGAENALGFDIDGVAGVSDAGGPVTVVFVNTDGGAADLALVLLNTSSVDAGDFLFAAAAAAASPATGGGMQFEQMMIV